MFTTSRQYLYLTLDEMVSYRGEAGELAAIAAWPVPKEAGNPDLSAFAAHIETFSGDRFYVMTDLPAEGYHEETIPNLRARDRRLLLRRRVDQQYRETRYRTVLPFRASHANSIASALRRQSGTTTRILGAMTAPDALAPWLNVLERRAVDVACLATVGSLMDSLVERFDVADRDALLIMRTGGGYRHTFTTANGVRFSRLCADPGVDGDTRLIGQDIDRTLQYLTIGKQLKLRPGMPLPVIVIDSTIGQELIVPGVAPVSIAVQTHKPADLVAAAPASLAHGRNAAWLLMNRAAFRPLNAGYAEGLPLVAANRRALARRVAMAAVSVSVAALTGYSALATVSALHNNQRTADLELQQFAVDKQTRAAEFLRPQLDVSPEQVRAVVLSHDRLMQRSLAADELLRSVAAALAPYQKVDIDQLEWSLEGANAAAAGDARVTADPAANSAVIVPSVPAVPPLTSALPAAGGRGSAPVPATGAAAVQSPAAQRLLHVAGHVSTQMRKAAANAAVGGFSDKLSAALGGKSQIQHLPYDVSPQGTLSAKHDPNAAEQPTYSFTVRFDRPDREQP